MYTKPQLKDAIEKLITLQIDEDDEEAYIAEMSRHIADPGWMNHVFHSREFVTDAGGMNLDALCDKILSYRPIAL